MSISYNKSLSLTGQDIYKQIYNTQYIQIVANSISFLVGSLIGSVFLFFLGDILINKKEYPYFYIFFILLIVLFIIMPLAINLLSYQKIESSKSSIIS